MSEKKKKASKASKDSNNDEDTFENLDSDEEFYDNTSENDDDDDEDINNDEIIESDDDEKDFDDFEASENQNISKSNNNDLDDDDDDDIFEYLDPEDSTNTQNLRVPDNERITIPRLTKYEKVRLLGTRIKQISDGSKIFIKSKDIKNATSIAELELKHKILPLKIKRPLPDGRYEIWSLNELEILD